MASVISRLRSRSDTDIQRAPSMFTHNGIEFPFEAFPAQTLPGSPVEASAADFNRAVRSIGSRSAIVSGAVDARALAMSQLYFRFRSLRDSSRLFGTPALAPLERPSADQTREDLLKRVEQDVAYHGNAYWRRTGAGIHRLRPDWVTIVIGSEERPDPKEAALAADSFVVGYVYKPGGEHSDHRAQFMSPAEIGHFAPRAHPLSNFIGEAWVTSVWREIAADMQATDHVSKFFDNAATANMVAITPPGITSVDDFNKWVDTFDAAHRGAVNAWRTIYLQNGSDVKVVGSDLGKLAMEDLQGGFETRVSAASRVPTTVALYREGNKGSALNAGNYSQIRRMWADSWFAPYAQSFCASMSRLITVPSDAELTYDPDRVLILQEDRKDAADIRQTDASTIRTLVDGGWEPDAAAEYVRNGGDIRRLIGGHTGLPSVQVQQLSASDRRLRALAELQEASDDD